MFRPQNLGKTPSGQGNPLINGLIKGGGDVVIGQIYCNLKLCNCLRVYKCSCNLYFSEFSNDSDSNYFLLYCVVRIVLQSTKDSTNTFLVEQNI